MNFARQTANPAPQGTPSAQQPPAAPTPATAGQTPAPAEPTAPALVPLSANQADHPAGAALAPTTQVTDQSAALPIRASTAASDGELTRSGIRPSGPRPLPSIVIHGVPRVQWPEAREHVATAGRSTDAVPPFAAPTPSRPSRPRRERTQATSFMLEGSSDRPGQLPPDVPVRFDSIQPVLRDIPMARRFGTLARPVESSLDANGESRADTAVAGFDAPRGPSPALVSEPSLDENGVPRNQSRSDDSPNEASSAFDPQR